MFDKILRSWLYHDLRKLPDAENLWRGKRAELVCISLLVRDDVVEQAVDGKPWLDTVEKMWENKLEQLNSIGLQLMTDVENFYMKQKAEELVESILLETYLEHDEAPKDLVMQHAQRYFDAAYMICELIYQTSVGKSIDEGLAKYYDRCKELEVEFTDTSKSVAKRLVDEKFPDGLKFDKSKVIRVRGSPEDSKSIAKLSIKFRNLMKKRDKFVTDFIVKNMMKRKKQIAEHYGISEYEIDKDLQFVPNVVKMSLSIINVLSWSLRFVARVMPIADPIEGIPLKNTHMNSVLENFIEFLAPTMVLVNMAREDIKSSYLKFFQNHIRPDIVKSKYEDKKYNFYLLKGMVDFITANLSKNDE